MPDQGIQTDRMTKQVKPLGFQWKSEEHLGVELVLQWIRFNIASVALDCVLYHWEPVFDVI
jgi:hypothetical protein